MLGMEITDNWAKSVSQMHLDLLKVDKQMNKLLIPGRIRNWFPVVFF